MLTPAAVWPEWVVTVPFMLLIALCCEDKPNVTRLDLCCVAALFLAMCVGIALQFVRNVLLACVLLVVALVAATWLWVAWYVASEELQRLVSQLQLKKTR